MTINKTMKFAIMFMAAITLMIITAFFPVKKDNLIHDYKLEKLYSKRNSSSLVWYQGTDSITVNTHNTATFVPRIDGDVIDASEYVRSRLFSSLPEYDGDAGRYAYLYVLLDHFGHVLDSRVAAIPEHIFREKRSDLDYKIDSVLTCIGHNTFGQWRLSGRPCRKKCSYYVGLIRVRV